MFDMIKEVVGPFWPSVCTGVVLFFAFGFGDWFFPSQTKAEVASRLNNMKTRPWPNIVIDLMDRILVGQDSGRRWVPKFGRVTAVSFGCMVAIVSVMLMSGSSLTEDPLLLGEGLHGLVFLVLTFFILNPIIDYISTIETRLMLSGMAHRNGVTWLFGLAVLDVVATTVIVFLSFPSITWVFWFYFVGSDDWLLGDLNWVDAANGWIDAMGSDTILSVYVYTTFATSLWMWLFVAAEAMFRIMPMVRRLFPVDEKPFSSVGLIVAIFGAFVVLAFQAIRALEGVLFPVMAA